MYVHSCAGYARECHGCYLQSSDWTHGTTGIVNLLVLVKRLIINVRFGEYVQL